jgi:Translation initiation factor IF-3, N-terminal domain
MQGGAVLLTMDEVRINKEIRAREVRLIGVDGSELGVTPLPEALRLAESLGLDLAEVAPNAEPPVCKIMVFRASAVHAFVRCCPAGRSDQRKWFVVVRRYSSLSYLQAGSRRFEPARAHSGHAGLLRSGLRCFFHR